MGNTFSADTDGIAKNSPYMNELGARLMAFHDWLEAVHEALGDSAGPPGDEFGDMFREQYDPSAKRILDTVKQARQLFESTSDGLHTMAKGLDHMENTHVETTRRLTTGSPNTGSTEHGTRG